MAFQIVDRRSSYRTKTITYSDTTTGSYQLTQEDYGYWLKVDTSEGQIELRLPAGLTHGYFNVVENVGSNKVIFGAETGQALEANYYYISVQYATAHLFYEGSSQWRLQGALGDQDLNALTDVTIPSSARVDGRVLAYSAAVDRMILVDPLPRGRYLTYTESYSTSAEHHGQTILLDTTLAPLQALLQDDEFYLLGYHLQLHNLGPAPVTVATSGTLLGTAGSIIPANGHAEVELVDVATWLLWGDLVNA